MSRGERTRARILAAARELLADCGDELTIELIGKELGVTKQAVLYHFPSKERLMIELALTGFARERDVVLDALGRASGPAALERFVRTLVVFYTEELDLFRLMYLRIQVLEHAVLREFPLEERRARLYPVTGAMFSAVEEALSRGKLRRGTDARATVVSAHMIAVGVATMYGATNAEGDSMRLPFEDYMRAALRPLLHGLQG